MGICLYFRYHSCFVRVYYNVFGDLVCQADSQCLVVEVCSTQLRLVIDEERKATDSVFHTDDWSHRTQGHGPHDAYISQETTSTVAVNDRSQL